MYPLVAGKQVLCKKVKFLKNRYLTFCVGRGDRIRTCDRLVPNQKRYRAALHPECFPFRKCGCKDTDKFCNKQILREVFSFVKNRKEKKRLYAHSESKLLDHLKNAELCWKSCENVTSRLTKPTSIL